MRNLHAVMIVVGIGVFTSFATSAETLQTPYDPVARAIALGLTPEAADAAFDRAGASAERCDAAVATLQTMACAPRDVATSDAPALPPLQS